MQRERVRLGDDRAAACGRGFRRRGDRRWRQGRNSAVMNGAATTPAYEHKLGVGLRDRRGTRFVYFQSFTGGAHCCNEMQAAIIGPLLDIPEGLLPRDSARLDAYMHEMLDSRPVSVSATGRALGRAILFPPGWRLMWPAFRALQLITIGLLPPPIRDGYGFRWTARDARAFARWSAALRRLHHATAPSIREWRAARRRAYRVGRGRVPRGAGSRRPSRDGDHLRVGFFGKNKRAYRRD